MFMGSQQHYEFQGEMEYFLGYFNDFAVLKSNEKGGILLTTSMES